MGKKYPDLFQQSNTKVNFNPLAFITFCIYHDDLPYILRKP